MYNVYTCTCNQKNMSMSLSLSLSLSLSSLSLSLPPSLSLFLPSFPSLPSSDHFALPWPLRLLETDECIVELQMTSTVDLEAAYGTCYSNYHATMMWYGQDGAQVRLGVRKHIRKQLKQVCECTHVLYIHVHVPL